MNPVIARSAREAGRRSNLPDGTGDSFAEFTLSLSKCSQWDTLQGAL